MCLARERESSIYITQTYQWSLLIRWKHVWKNEDKRIRHSLYLIEAVTCFKNFLQQHLVVQGPYHVSLPLLQQMPCFCRFWFGYLYVTYFKPWPQPVCSTYLLIDIATLSIEFVQYSIRKHNQLLICSCFISRTQ